MRVTTSFVLLVAAFALASCASPNTIGYESPQLEHGIIVPTTEGLIRGLNEGHTQAFLGIPYGKPPVRDLRFAPPQALHEIRTSIYDATRPRNACIQLQEYSPIPTSEDCLYLNIYRPALVFDAAVMLWIHGGNFIEGTGANYNGSYFVEHSNTIVVTINYRMNAFGFLATHEGLAEDGTTGNYGIQDQRLALEWVIKNIGFFGGNKHKITIAGESAGAFSVCTHLAAPRSRDLYRAAILESIYQNCDALSLNDAISSSAAVVTGLKCNGTTSVLSCLRDAPASAVLALSIYNTWKPVVDGYELTKQPFEYIANGSYSKVPILIGSNQDEAAYLICGVEPFQSFTFPQLNQFLTSIFGAYLTAYIDALYNVTSFPAPYRAQIAIESDYLFKCPTKRLAGLIDSAVPVWMYSFNYVPRGKCGAAHATEVAFIFPSRLDILGANYTFNAAELRLSREMRGFWRSFVENLTPAYHTQPIAWPRYSEPAEQYLNLNVTLSVGNHFRSPYCEFWERIVPLQPLSV